MQENKPRFVSPGFDPKTDIETSGDLLERKPLAETLNSLLANVDSPFVLAIRSKSTRLNSSHPRLSRMPSSA